ncbi:1288_t:CDS:2 [Dentiscutata heterogama]|uniref:1288_t:CDS:1 n=1 Tax=Dentiscutata heterogama TaxID=1316150 RepID=A0ACA9KP14_9GLOM|nr:1288_t:CDS:2 [Dentiscutata heterogama]
MKISIFGIVLTLFVVFVFVIDASKLRKREIKGSPCLIKVVSPGNGNIYHHGHTHKAIWKPYLFETTVRVIIIASSNSTGTHIKVFDESTTFGATGIQFTVGENWPSDDYEYVLYAFNVDVVETFGESETEQSLAIELQHCRFYLTF